MVTSRVLESFSIRSDVVVKLHIVAVVFLFAFVVVLLFPFQVEVIEVNEWLLTELLLVNALDYVLWVRELHELLFKCALNALHHLFLVSFQVLLIRFHTIHWQKRSVITFQTFLEHSR